MGWWIFWGILALILLLPLGASVFYDAKGVRVLVIVGPVRFTVFPGKKKEKKPETEKKPDTKVEQSEPKPAEKKPVPEQSALPQPAKTALPDAPKPPQDPQEAEGGSLMDFIPLVELALKFVGEFFHRTLHIDVLYLKLTMAGDDPADLAINYGKTWVALGNLWPYVDRMFTIKKRDIQVQCDFEATQPLVNAQVDITLNLARILGLVFDYGFRIGVRFLQILWDRKKAADAAKSNKQTQS